MFYLFGIIIGISCGLLVIQMKSYTKDSEKVMPDFLTGKNGEQKKMTISISSVHVRDVRDVNHAELSFQGWTCGPIRELSGDLRFYQYKERMRHSWWFIIFSSFFVFYV